MNILIYYLLVLGTLHKKVFFKPCTYTTAHTHKNPYPEGDGYIWKKKMMEMIKRRMSNSV